MYERKFKAVSGQLAGDPWSPGPLNRTSRHKYELKIKMEKKTNPIICDPFHFDQKLLWASTARQTEDKTKKKIPTKEVGYALTKRLLTTDAHCVPLRFLSFIWAHKAWDSGAAQRQLT